MIHDLSFVPEVEDDAIAGYHWYEQKAPGLGEEFLRVFYASASEAARDPLHSPKVYGEFRRRLLRRFPYALYYRIEEPTVVVYGLLHCARSPLLIRGTLIDRTAG
ncbi:MAG: hypothetical protein AUJ92_10005 [Armatimonadetes bacterium CG2_30_59_28]|nr:type II toxin-antitoxin system RelE/ParE family toxin [Armatimonadota bacterium]OIO94483.1 MAG: hypothetical protein AUJ92_10005 [Armatimonadetes bacterium CG2_30_59_28]PIU66225.1 MAG: hypothetical protein COS85_05625 [Armatimonadetes bacterium CG07_land_8_20_14_0_80_59_28]PIX40123.1 MAG: hypothetical protein COZ56_15500 [Armatimonadetes bacterium CG_4_8_14_3_um_filter_58_9]PIY41074.1 MAG: hypothetical protein COZ05_16270 [Armatimonadetes bacterium CG_4_10_14_3_um_filter_59_10]